MDPIERIRLAEQNFAREVALNVLYLRPPKMWQNLIPGMFIFDFLRRSRAIRRYTKKYMFPRRLALDALNALSGSTAKESVHRRTRDRIDAELHPLKLPTPDLAQAYHVLVELLTEHYRRLTRVPGDRFDELIRVAYPSAKEFENHLNQLAAAEGEIDRAVVNAVGKGTSLGEALQLEAGQVDQRRRKQMERIFGSGG